MFLYLIVTTSESYLWTDNIRQRSAWAIRLCKPKLHKILERYQTRPRKLKEIRNQPVTRPPTPEPPFIVIDFSFNQTTLSKPPTTAGKKYILKICNPSNGLDLLKSQGQAINNFHVDLLSFRSFNFPSIEQRSKIPKAHLHMRFYLNLCIWL